MHYWVTSYKELFCNTLSTMRPASHEGHILQTDRLILRELTLDDAEFILGLLNEPSFLQHIGDKGVRTLAGARNYLETGPLDSYREHGFGLYLVEGKSPKVPMGICGLVKRDILDDADIGFAFVPEFWSQGYAFESAAAVLTYARETLGHERVLAVVSPDNQASIRLLEKLDLSFERMIQMSDDENEILLFS